MVNCLVCDKELPFEGDFSNGNVIGGGFMIVSFHFGSRHDQLGKCEETSQMEKLLNCDQIEAFICDDCFEKKFSKMHGYQIIDEPRRRLVIQ